MNATARKKVDIKCWAGESSNKDISCDGTRYWFTCGVSRVYYCESCARSLYTVPSFLYSFLWFIAQICMMEKFPIVWYTLVKKSHSHKSWNTLNYIRLCKWNVICNKTLLLANQIVWFLFMKKSIKFVSNILWRKNLKNDNILNCIDQNMCYYIIQSTWKMEIAFTAVYHCWATFPFELIQNILTYVIIWTSYMESSTL